MLAVLIHLPVGVLSQHSVGFKELLSGAQKAVGQIVVAARKTPELSPDQAKAKPFWDAMKALNEALGKTETGMLLKDETFFSNLATASAMLAQAQVGVGMSGSSDTEVAEGMKLLSGLIRKMDENFSKEAARLRQGGQLSEAEKLQLKTLKEQVMRMEAKLAAVEKSTAGSNPNIRNGIKNIRSHRDRVMSADNTVGGFVGGLIAGRLITEWVWGWHWWWGPWGGWCPGWVDINIDVWVDWVDAIPYDWALVDDYRVDATDLEMDWLDMEADDLDLAEAYLDETDFELADGDLAAFTEDLDLGWDDVESDVGLEIQEEMESNWDHVPYKAEFEPATFDDHGIDDFGGGYDDWGGDLDFGW